MAELKTKATAANVAKFLEAIKDEKRRQDCQTIAEIMRKAARAEPKMWGTSIVGFGDYHYVYESGREGDWFVTGFSPRKQNITLYVMGGYTRHTELLDKLGKHKTGGGCLYINSLDDMHLPTLRKLIHLTVRLAKKKA